ncbi:MAG: adenylyltransferase/cytidyltransferase family protein [Myxococcales bacterium]|nr:adenylyltransferase/cytidyltransferase family protein [Myxococcales bacterium]
MTAIVELDYRSLRDRLSAARREGKTIALANGCFDVLHVGHIRLLRDAATEADLLVVALNTDASVRAQEGKGGARPFIPLEERAEIIAALRVVDFVTSFPEATAHELIDALRPDVQIKGTDRDPATVPERAVLEGYGGRIAICGDAKTHASSDVIRRMRTGG